MKTETYVTIGNAYDSLNNHCTRCSDVGHRMLRDKRAYEDNIALSHAANILADAREALSAILAESRKTMTAEEIQAVLDYKEKTNERT
jgi:hypothetical protein